MGTLAAGMKEIFSSAQTTATHLPTCSSDGTPTGRISTSDLASVLGVKNTSVFVNIGSEGVATVDECCIMVVLIGSDVFAVVAKGLDNINILADPFGLLSTQDISNRYYISNSARDNKITIKNNMTHAATAVIRYIGLSRNIY